MAASRAPSSGYKWGVVGMLWLVCFFNYADRQAIFSVFPKLEQEFGFSKTQLGLIGSAFMWVYAGGAPFAGFIADRVKRKHLILGGCLFWSAVTVCTGWCSKLWHFVTVRALEGFGETFYFPASMSLLSDYHAKTRSRAMSLHQSSVYIGTIAGSFLGAWFAERYGWRVGFYFFGLGGMLLAIVLYFTLREPVRGEAESPGEVPEKPVSAREAARMIFASPAARLLLLAFMGANFVATIFLTWTPTFLVEKFNFRLTAAGLSGVVFIHLTSALSAPLGGVLADRWSKTTGGGRVRVQMLGLLIGAPFVYFVGRTADVQTLLWVMVGFGFCKGFYDSNIFASMYDLIEPRARATAAGVMNMIGWGGGALGPLFVGWFTDHGGGATKMDNMSSALAWSSAVYVVGGILLAWAALRMREQGTRSPATA